MSRSIQICLCLFSIFLFSLPRAYSSSWDKPIAKLVEEILQEGSLQNKRIAIAELADPEKRVTQLSTLISETLEAELSKHSRARGFQLVNRRNLQELVEEWKLGMYGFVDGNAAPQAGKLLGVEIFLMGTYTDTGKKISLRISLVHSETGQLLAGKTTEIKATPDLKALAEKVLKGAAIAQAPNESLKVELWSDKENYKIGEKMKVYAKTNQDCYLTLIDVGTSGNATLIFPNHYAPGNAIKAGVAYTIPDPAAGFEFEVASPAGIELIRAIASREPAIDLKEALSSFNAENPFAAVKQPEVLTRDIHVQAKKAKKGDWSEAVLRLTIQRGL